ncbi:putative serine/threonine-protein kinase mkcB [Leucoagaricus sp. SymC.cos]|nr:putative serine/threonine-protein kinase mkcB [Leucoagaricus sp. SymC.cos]
MGCTSSHPMDEAKGSAISRSVPAGKSQQNYHDSLKLLLALIGDRTKRHALADLKGDQAKNMVEFLNQILDPGSEPYLQNPVARKNILHTLSSLVRSVLVLPESLKFAGLDDNLSEGLHSEGRFDNVYKKKDKEGRMVFIKVTRDMKTGTNIQGILRIHAKEAVLRAYMGLPNILPLYGAHISDGTGGPKIWIVSPWMENGDLLTYRKGHPNLSLQLMADVISGLNYLHELAIIHGSLRAANILVSSQGRAVLANFEVSRVSLADPGISDDSVGDIWWMAPESLLMDSESVPTLASDIWSFACTCYEILTGQTPFRHQGMTQAYLIRALGIGQGNIIPTWPVHINRNEAQIWDKVLTKCWKVRASERPDTASILSALFKWTTVSSEKDELWNITRQKSGFTIKYEPVHNVLKEIQESTI